MHPYSTHLPYLARAILTMDALGIVGTIVECGAGRFSTFFLHNMLDGCKAIHTLETNQDWYNKVKHLESEGHKFTLLAETAELYRPPHLFPTPPSVVLIDGEAATRKPMLDFFVSREANAIVIHDTEPRVWKHYGWTSEYFESLPYVAHHFNSMTPGTTILWKKSVAECLA